VELSADICSQARALTDEPTFIVLNCSIVPRTGADRIEEEHEFEADSVRYPDRIEEEHEFEADSVRYPDRIEEEHEFEAEDKVIGYASAAGDLDSLVDAMVWYLLNGP
jgi:hypothetical protein